MEIIMVGGYPGSGKSYIFKELIHRLEQEGYVFKERKAGIVRYMESDKLIILGSYAEGEKFPGTDRLPLNAQPEAQKLLAVFAEKNRKDILFEGDRLFNDKMIAFFRGRERDFELVLCIVRVARDILVQRRDARSQQNESWRKGRESKVDRIAMVYPIQHILWNNTKEEQETSVEELLAEIKGKWKQEDKSSRLKNFWS